jgi:hypothetical protein
MSTQRSSAPRPGSTRFISSDDIRDFVLSEEGIRKLEKERLLQARKDRKNPQRYRDELAAIASAREDREARAKEETKSKLAILVSSNTTSPVKPSSNLAKRNNSISWASRGKEAPLAVVDEYLTPSGELQTPLSESEAFISSSEEDAENPGEWTTHVTAEVQERVDALPSKQQSASMEGLPTELQIQIFGYLDRIDSVCLGLTSPHHYAIFQALHPEKMLLNSRRVGQAGTVERSWELVGRDTCNHCGTYRCQLWRHIKDWMPDYLVSDYTYFPRSF